MSTPFTDDDKAFLRTILSNPAELTAWLVYADWLDERDDPRAEFVRLEVRRYTPNRPQRERLQIEGRLRTLREQLDPDWVAVFDRPRIENCTPQFAFECPKKWENLTATETPAERFCAGCQKTVYYCADMLDARVQAGRGNCVAIAVGVPRSPGDLRPTMEYVTMGVLLPPPAPPPEEGNLLDRIRRRFQNRPKRED